MNLYLIRHGDPDYSTDSLTAKGVLQAELLGNALREINFNRIFQSPMGRAQQTAKVCMEQWDNPGKAQTLQFLSELCWGDRSGNAWAGESPWSINYNFIRERHSYPKGEAWKKEACLQNDRLIADVEQRSKLMDEFLEQNGYKREGQVYLGEKADNENIAFFCHGGIISALTAHLMNIPFWQFIAQIELEVTSVTKIEFSPVQGEYAAAKLRYLNKTWWNND